MNNIAVFAALVAANHNLRTNVEMARKVEENRSWTEWDEENDEDEEEDEEDESEKEREE